MNLTLGQFQEIYSIQKSDLDDIEKSIQTVSVLTGKTERQIDEMPLPEFNHLSKMALTAYDKAKLNTKPVNIFKVNGKKYKVQYNPSKLDAGQYIDVQHFLKGDMIDNADKILASICNEVKWFRVKKYSGKNHSQIAEDIKQVPFNDAYGSVVFFCQLFAASIKGLEDYLANHLQTKEQKETLKKSIVSLCQTTDGFITQSELVNLKT